MLFQDNLDSQKQPAYLDFLRKWGVDDHKLPPNETDKVQPIDRGLGRQIKIYTGQFLDDWLDDDDNLTKWEENTLTASDQPTDSSGHYLGTWHYNVCRKALEGDAKLKYMYMYFQHAGALLTADGSDDELIMFEGTPVG